MNDHFYSKLVTSKTNDAVTPIFWIRILSMLDQLKKFQKPKFMGHKKND